MLGRGGLGLVSGRGRSVERVLRDLELVGLLFGWLICWWECLLVSGMGRVAIWPGWVWVWMCGLEMNLDACL